jgi:hypothetical protein
MKLFFFFFTTLSRFKPFCPGESRSVPGQKGRTKRLGQNVPVPFSLTIVPRLK